MTETNKVVCGKCAGSGEFVFKSGARGVCFPCEGTGQVEPQEIKAGAFAIASTTTTLRAMYKNAAAGRLSLADVFDADRLGWTPAGLRLAFDLVPGSREAFRALGWNV